MIFSFSNNKGGVGKTSLTISLAHALALQNKKVLVIDLDSQGNASDILFPEKKNQNLASFLANEETFANIIFETRIKNLYGISNGIKEDPEYSSLIPLFNSYLHSKDPKALFFQNQEKFLYDNFEFILVDSPPDIGVFTINALDIASTVIIPILASSARSVDGMRNINHLLQDMGLSKPIKIIVNNFDGRRITDKLIKETILDAEGLDSFNNYIQTSTLFSKGEITKETIFEVQKQGIYSIKQLAFELINIKEEK